MHICGRCRQQCGILICMSEDRNTTMMWYRSFHLQILTQAYTHEISPAYPLQAEQDNRRNCLPATIRFAAQGKTELISLCRRLLQCVYHRWKHLCHMADRADMPPYLFPQALGRYPCKTVTDHRDCRCWYRPRHKLQPKYRLWVRGFRQNRFLLPSTHHYFLHTPVFRSL